jgi:tape measure domain-containing protein
MATIESAIRLNDMMSAPLRHITDAMNMMLSSWTDLESSTSDGLNVGNIESIRSKLNQATSAMDQMGDEQENLNRKIRNGSNEMDGFADKILGAVAAYASFQGMQKLVNLSDTYTQTQARLSMIVDEQSNVDELNNKIFASAQRARASYQDMADAVAKLSLNAGDAFSSNDETILFAENLNKLFAIAGTEAASVQSATLQLTQALGSGVLRGEEFNAVFEAAPNIMMQVAEYMNVPIGSLREMAKEGQITAEIVKNALLSATTEINAQFESMPMTWAQVWTQVTNSLYQASIPLLNFINLLANNWSVLAPIIGGVATAVGIYTAALLIHKGIATVTAIVEGVRAAATMMSTGATFAATAAQHGFNAALLACPITWIIIAIIAVIAIIYAVVAAINDIQGTTISATGVILGVLTSAVSIIWNLFLGLVSMCIQGVLLPLTYAWDTFANLLGNIFNDPIAAIIRSFQRLANTVLGILKTIANAIDAIFGSNLSGAVDGWKDGLSGKADALVEKYGNGTYEEKSNLTEQLQGVLSDAQQRFSWQTSDAYNLGYEWGVGVDKSVGNIFGSNLGEEYSLDNLMQSVGDIPTIGELGGIGEIPEIGGLEDPKIDEIAENTGDIKNSLDKTNEDLKWLRDIAEQSIINRFTTAEVRVDMGGINNIVNQNTDLDGIIDYVVVGVQEAMERVAEGVHN